jgi:hypothetical protein
MAGSARTKVAFRGLLTDLVSERRLLQEDVDYALISSRDQRQKSTYPIKRVSNFEFSAQVKSARNMDQCIIC